MTLLTYRDNLCNLVEAMSMPNEESRITQQLDAADTPDRIKMFVDGNLEKRYDKLVSQLELLPEGFEDLEGLIRDFIRAESLAAFSSAASDGERFLRWLTATHELTARQRDYVACQRARHLIEELAQQDRLGYLRFHERHSLVDELTPRLGIEPGLRIYLNPIRTWSRFETDELLGSEAEAPANVLFFASQGEVATAALELEGQALLNELADFEPCTIDDWATLSRLADREELVDFCRDLASIGVVAIA